MTKSGKSDSSFVRCNPVCRIAHIFLCAAWTRRPSCSAAWQGEDRTKSRDRWAQVRRMPDCRESLLLAFAAFSLRLVLCFWCMPEHVEVVRLMARRLAAFLYDNGATTGTGLTARYNAQTVKKVPGWGRHQERMLSEDLVSSARAVCPLSASPLHLLRAWWIAQTELLAPAMPADLSDLLL
jgi:hypothetical protein